MVCLDSLQQEKIVSQLTSQFARGSFFIVMSKVPRLLLYWLATLAGLTGVLAEGISLLKNLKDKLFDPDYSLLLNSYDYFSAGVIFLLSLMLLILVHIGHVVAGGFHISGFRKQSDSVKLPGNPSGAASLPPESGAAQMQMDKENKETADEKLSRLLKSKKE